MILGLPLVFHRDRKPISSVTFNKWFRVAADIAVPTRKIPHDCRRTAIRNLLRMGVREDVAMKMVGWKTRAMMSRYNITCESDYDEVRELYAEHMKRRAAEAERRVVKFGGGE
jgi:integrase